MLRRLKASSDASQPSPNAALDDAQTASEQGVSDGPIYNGPGTYPRIVFNTKIFHPYVYEDTKELMKPKFRTGTPSCTIWWLCSPTSSGYLLHEGLPDMATVANGVALDMFRHDPENYVQMEECGRIAHECHNNEQGSTIRFTKQ
ncbi:ubiquitin-conjugating enzyme subfamily protein [Phytophthora cinnamomi]|uniref:ubiquitin-conjugating enzyme subfamily protein n=1 Tax=Phytophthora cinnamomi TaxID=4785 RepID=UPI003559EDED|nr:ubiquitin-conjugating enzyme subfamily protein [Phytophthora cinnamomi]